MNDLVVVRDLVKRFGSFVAVNRASLKVGAGEVVGLLGANGAGKTTLIRCLLGLLDFDAGTVSLLDEPPNREVLRRVGYVPQGLGLYADLTVSENLDFRSEIFDSKKEEKTGDDRRVGALPRGLQRRAAFRAALAHRPQILVLDEPTSGVDPWARADLWDTIRSKVTKGAGALVTTHHLEEAEYCDRLVLMAAGQVVKTGSLSDLLAGQTAVEIATEYRDDAYAALRDAGLSVVLAGRRLRVMSSDQEKVGQVLRDGGVAGSTESVAANLDEVFLVANDGATPGR